MAIGVAAAVMIAAAIGFALASTLTTEQLQTWGWRVPLAFGCLIVPVMFLLRRDLSESDEFAARTRRHSVSEILRGLWRRGWQIVIGMGLVLTTTVSFYMITAYTPTFGKLLNLPAAGTLVVTGLVGLSNLIWLPLMGALSDRIGRRPILLTCTILILATAYPAMQWLADAPSFTRLLLVDLWLSALYASYNAAMVVYLTQIVPAEIRASGFSLAYSLATAVGGFTPFLCTWLIAITGDKAIPGAWLSAMALISLAATLWSGYRSRSTPPVPLATAIG